MWVVPKVGPAQDYAVLNLGRLCAKSVLGQRVKRRGLEKDLHTVPPAEGVDRDVERPHAPHGDAADVAPFSRGNVAPVKESSL